MLNKTFIIVILSMVQINSAGSQISGANLDHEFKVSGFQGKREGDVYIIKSPSNKVVVRYPEQIFVDSYLSKLDEEWLLVDLCKKRKDELGGADFFGILLIEKIGQLFYARDVLCLDNQGNVMKDFFVVSFENIADSERSVRIKIAKAKSEETGVSWPRYDGVLNLDTGVIDHLKGEQ